jgi:tRNA (guanine26-N2/guanine27-N2)-dimethyltransferase
VETRRSSHLADAQLERLGWLLECAACLHRGFAAEAERACPACAAPARASGPMWTGELWDAGLLAAMAKAREGRTLARWRAVDHDLALWQAEAAAEPGALPHDTHLVAEREGIAEGAPVERVLALLQAAGFAASRTHLGGMLLRTAAPAREVVRATREAAAAYARERGSERPAPAGDARK